MESALVELEEILSREATVHDSLLQTAREFNKALRESDLAAIQQHTNSQDEQTFAIEQLEEQRIECLGTLSQALGLHTAHPGMQTVLEIIPQTWRERLSHIHASLKQKITDLAQINTSNQILIEDALTILNSTFTALRQPSEKFSQYGGKGTTATGAAPSRTFINRIA